MSSTCASPRFRQSIRTGISCTSADGLLSPRAKSPSPTVSIDLAIFTGADVTLSAYHAGSGTFVGAPAFQGVTLVRADTASYCIQAARGALVQHEAGPGGPVQTGPC